MPKADDHREMLIMLGELVNMVEAGEKWYTRIVPGFIGKSVVEAEQVYAALFRLQATIDEGGSLSPRHERRHG